MTQFKVPQNIDMQDRIVGPLTLFQFLYLLIGGMIFYATLKTPSVIDLIFIGIPVGMFSLALAFIKVNDQPFSRFILSFIMFLTHPKTRVWHHGSGTPEITVAANQSVTNKRIERKAISPDMFKKMAQELDKGA